MRALSSRESRLAAVGVLALVLVGAYVLIVAPLWSTYHAYDIAIDDLQTRLGRYTAIARTRLELEARLARIGARPARSTDFLEGEGDAITAAGLQQRVSDIIAKAGARVLVARVLDPETKDGLRRIGLSIQFEGEADALREVLYTLEAGQPILFIDGLEVREARTFGRRRAKSGPVRLHVKIDLYGYQEVAGAKGA